MAILYVTEFSDLARPGMYGADSLTIPMFPQKAIQQVTISSSSIASTAFQQGTQYIQLHADAICAVSIGTAPVASAATSFRMAAGETRIYAIPLNQSYKVAAITTT